MRLESIRWEIAQTARRIRRSPGFALAVVASLAVGIGADVTMLGIADALLFRPPAHVRDVERVVHIRVNTYPDFADLRDQARSFSGIAAWFAPPRPYVITQGDRYVPAQQMLASAALFPLLGAQPALGRFFTAEEDRPGGPHVAVLGYAMWQQLFGGASDVLGRTLRVAGDLYTIIGVAPRDFTGVALTRVDLFLPITTTKFDASIAALTSRIYSWVRVVARLAPGVTVARAQAEAKVIYARGNPGDTVTAWQIATFGGRPADVHPVMEQRREMATSSVPVALWLVGVATAVLLIACANVAGLLLARAARGRREIAVRAALGASTRRLVASLMLESGLLAFTGGAAGLVVSRWTDAIIRGFILTDLAPVTAAIDPRMLAVALGVTIATALLSGLWPAWRAVRGDLAREIASGSRTASAPHATARRVLLVSQLALATTLLIGAVLFSASLRNAKALDLGMSLDRVLMSELDLAAPGYTPERAHALIDPLIERLHAIPGVRSVALTDAGLQPGWMNWAFSVPGHDSPSGGRVPAAHVSFSAVTPEFLSTIGTPIVRGRDFTRADRADRVIIVSEGFARTYWPGEDPLGRCVRVDDRASAACTTVIGVARDRRVAPGDTSTLIEAFVPLASPAEPAIIAKLFTLKSVAMRVDGDLSRTSREAQRVLQEMLPDAASIRVRPALSMFDRAVRAWRLGASMFGAFGAIAVGLAVLGVYATIAYLVTQRRRELAIRVALGADAFTVARLVFGETLRVTAAGVVIGAVGAAWLAHGIRVFLFEISPLNPGAYAGAAGALVAVALAASILPVWRAVRSDPTITLRDG
jgi:predicted permease